MERECGFKMIASLSFNFGIFHYLVSVNVCLRCKTITKKYFDAVLLLVILHL